MLSTAAKLVLAAGAIWMFAASADAQQFIRAA